MTNFDLAGDYLKRATSRMKAVELLFNEANYPDTIRESQELVELILKALLRRCHVDPPHWHDVSQILIDNRSKLPPALNSSLDRITQLSRALRKERELAFYGENDFIPGREYDKNQAEQFVNETRWLLKSVVEALA